MSRREKQEMGTVLIARNGNGGYREAVDLSQYRTITIEAKAEATGERIGMYLRDNRSMPEGEHHLHELCLSRQWNRYSFPLSSFPSVDLTRVYAIEFDFRELGCDAAIRRIEFER